MARNSAGLQLAAFQPSMVQQNAASSTPREGIGHRIACRVSVPGEPQMMESVARIEGTDNDPAVQIHTFQTPCVSYHQAAMVYAALNSRLE